MKRKREKKEMCFAFQTLVRGVFELKRDNTHISFNFHDRDKFLTFLKTRDQAQFKSEKIFSMHYYYVGFFMQFRSAIFYTCPQHKLKIVF